MKTKIEEIKYKCSKCGKNFPFEEMTEDPQKKDDGSVTTFYICKHCKLLEN